MPLCSDCERRKTEDTAKAITTPVLISGGGWCGPSDWLYSWDRDCHVIEKNSLIFFLKRRRWWRYRNIRYGITQWLENREEAGQTVHGYIKPLKDSLPEFSADRGGIQFYDHH